MSSATDAIGTTPYRLRNPRNPRHLIPDLLLLFRKNRDGEYILNNRLGRWQALKACYVTAVDHVEMIAREGKRHSWLPGRGNLLSVSRGSNTKTTVGIDLQTHMTNGDSVLGDTGTSTATGATSLTDSGKAWTTNAFAGHKVYTGGVYAVILSNTATALTLDKWYTVATPGGAAASTPGTGTYIISLESAPAQWIGITTDATAPSAADTTLASEANTNGVTRAFATFAHTPGAATATLAKTFTCTGNVGVLAKIGAFNAANGGTMFAESLLNATANLAVAGDNAAVTWTFTHS